LQILKQSKDMPIWIGAFQVQIQNSLFYMNLVFMSMSVMTFWYTAGYQVSSTYAQWLTLPIFVGFVVLLFIIVMIVDYKIILPSRQAFQNEQACKHENPAMYVLLDIQDRVVKLEKLLADKPKDK
jgi:uncharacterized membrane protein